MEQVGFVYLPSPRGFDHTVQLTILDRDGRVHRQVYGEVFPTPQLIEPLKDLVFNRPSEATGLLDRIGDRIRLFCTVYDAQGDRYMFDYSLFAGMFIGTVFLGSAIAWLLVEIRRSRRSRPA
jgi:protein SCO1/2